MSKSSSGSKKANSLAKCYNHFENKKWAEKYVPGSSKSAVAGVEEKIDEAIKKDPSYDPIAATNAAQPSSPIPVNAAQSGLEVGGPPQIDTLTGQAGPGNTDSQDGGVMEASAATVLSLDPERKKNMAAALIDPKQLWDSFFSGIVTDDTSDAVEDNVEEYRLEFAHSMEISHASNRSERRFSDICDLP